MTFFQKIQKVNEILKTQGVSVIQEKKMMKNGRVVGKVQYGYLPQAVFDAINEIIGPENWRYEISENGVQLVENQAIACAKVFFRIGDEWLSKGLHYGQSNVVKGNIGDAMKGAITDALQKGMSLWGIGSAAYRGELEAVFKNKTKDQPNELKSKSESNFQPPRIEGVLFENKDGRLIAKGKTFGKTTALKHAGFQWDPKSRGWYKEAA